MATFKLLNKTTNFIHRVANLEHHSRAESARTLRGVARCACARSGHVGAGSSSSSSGVRVVLRKDSLASFRSP